MSLTCESVQPMLPLDSGVLVSVKLGLKTQILPLKELYNIPTYSLTEWSKGASWEHKRGFPFKLQKLICFFAPPSWYFSTPTPTHANESLKVYSSTFAGSSLFGVNKNHAGRNDSVPPQSQQNPALPGLSWTESSQWNHCGLTWSCQINRNVLVWFYFAKCYGVSCCWTINKIILDQQIIYF